MPALLLIPFALGLVFFAWAAVCLAAQNDRLKAERRHYRTLR